MRERKPMTLRVVHVVQAMGEDDGISNAVRNMLRAQADGRVDATLLVGRWTPYQSGQLADVAGVRALPMRRLASGRLGDLLSYPQDFLRVLSELALQADVVHLHGLWRYPSLVGAWAIRRIGVPYVTSPHGVLTREALRHNRLRKLVAFHLIERRTLVRSSAVVATSADERDALLALGIPARNLVVIPLAVDVQRLVPLAAARWAKISSQRRRIALVVSRLHSIKRIVELVAAFATVSSEYPQWDLVIVGREDERGYAERIGDEINRNSLASRVRVAGARAPDDLHESYASAHLFVLPSASENFGLVVAEALAAGLPVITTTGAPWREVIWSRSGWRVEPTVRSLAQALRSAFALTDHERHQMGLRGQRLVWERYSLTTLGTRLMDLYATVKKETVPG